MFWCVLLDYFIIILDCPCGILQLYFKHKTLKTYSGWKLTACEFHYVLFSFHCTLPIITDYQITNHSHWYKKIKCQEKNYLQGTRQIIWSFIIQQNWICLLVFKILRAGTLRKLVYCPERSTEVLQSCSIYQITANGNQDKGMIQMVTKR